MHKPWNNISGGYVLNMTFEFVGRNPYKMLKIEKWMAFPFTIILSLYMLG